MMTDTKSQPESRGPLRALAEAEDVAASLYREHAACWPQRMSMRVLDIVIGNHRNNRDVLEQLERKEEAPSIALREGNLVPSYAVNGFAHRLSHALEDEPSPERLLELEQRLVDAYEKACVPEIEALTDHAQRVLGSQLLRRARQNSRLVRLLPTGTADAESPHEDEGWIDQVTDQSFPASDPPCWTATHA